MSSYIDNPLSAYDTYTYNLALYQVHPSDVNDLEAAVSESNRSILIADNSKETRYNIGRVEQTHAMGHGQVRAAFGNQFDFTISEPNGTTFLKTLRENAVRLGVPHPKDLRYILVISFVGRKSDNRAHKLPQKFYYPLVISKFEFNISDGGTIYSLHGIENNSKAYSYLENVIKNQITFEASTVNEFIQLLNDKIKDSEELNLQYNANALYPDTYEIELDSEIQSWGNWQFQQASDGLEVSGQSKIGLGADGKMHFSITNGSNITDIVGLALQATDEYKKIVLHDGGFCREDGAHEPSTAKLSSFKTFYKVITNVEYKQYDVLRGEYSKHIIYRIKPYIVADEIADSTEYLNSISDPQIQSTRVRNLISEGLMRKRYDYLYTGQNTEILDLDLRFDYAYFAVSVIGNGRFGDHNVVSQTAGKNDVSPLAKLQHNKIELRDIAKQADALVQQFESRRQATAKIYQDALISRAIQEETDELKQDLANIESRAEQLRQEQQDLVRQVNDSVSDSTNGIDMRLQFAGDIVDDSDAYGPESDLLGGALNFAAVKTNLENSADMITIEMKIKGDPYWLGKPNSFLGYDKRSTIDTADYERGGQFFYLKVNLGNDENSQGRKEPHTEYQVTAVYRVTNVISQYEGGMFIQYLKCVRDLGTNVSSVAEVLEMPGVDASGGGSSSVVLRRIDVSTVQEQLSQFPRLE